MTHQYKHPPEHAVCSSGQQDQCKKSVDSIVALQALAEKESDGMAKMIYRKDTGDILGVHIFGLHAADLIHEASNAMATQQRVQVGLTRFLSCRFLHCPNDYLFWSFEKCIVSSLLHVDCLKCGKRSLVWSSLTLFLSGRVVRALLHASLLFLLLAGHQVQCACSPHALRGAG